MRLHRFYISEDFVGQGLGGQGLSKPGSGSVLNSTSNLHAGQELSIDLSNERLIHQWRDIFRFGTGDRMLIFNEAIGEWLAEFKSLDKKNGAVLEIIEQDRVVEIALPKRNIALYMAIIKNSNFDLVVEKATELGVSRIVPITSERTVKSGLNFERLAKLTIEASEQSGRIGIPEISEIMEIAEAIQDAKQNYDQVFFGHIDPAAENIKNSSEGSDNGDDVVSKAIFIGPEGGWSDVEVSIFENEGVQAIGLGQFVLRAETAAIVGLSVIS